MANLQQPVWRGILLLRRKPRPSGSHEESRGFDFRSAGQTSRRSEYRTAVGPEGSVSGATKGIFLARSAGATREPSAERYF